MGAASMCRCVAPSSLSFLFWASAWEAGCVRASRGRVGQRLSRDRTSPGGPADRRGKVEAIVPTPIGHALGAMAAGWLVGRPPAARRALATQVLVLVALGMAPDLDLIIGRHSRETHSVGAAVLVGLIAAWQRWPIAVTRFRVFAAACLAWGSHPLLDALGVDMTIPRGVMAWWPFSQAHVQTGLDLFLPIYRRSDPAPVAHNVVAALREIAILGPVVAFVWWWQRSPSRFRPRRERVEHPRDRGDRQSDDVRIRPLDSRDEA